MLPTRLAASGLILILALAGCGGTPPSPNSDKATASAPASGRASANNNSTPTVDGVLQAFSQDDLATKKLLKQYAVCSTEGPSGCKDGIALRGVTVEIYATTKSAEKARKEDSSQEFNAAQLPAYRAGVVVLEWDSNVDVLSKSKRKMYSKSLDRYNNQLS